MDLGAVLGVGVGLAWLYGLADLVAQEHAAARSVRVLSRRANRATRTGAHVAGVPGVRADHARLDDLTQGGPSWLKSPTSRG